MDLSKYIELTGINVSASKVTYFEAQINRCLSMLETMLGFTLDPDKVNTNLYNELGKTQDECACPSTINEEQLQDPDDVEGAYRLFKYNELDKYLHIDPFAEIYKVKLIHVKPGAGNDGITLKTFDDEQVRVDIGRDGLGKYLEICKDCFCECDCTNCIQLAVDAKWLWTGEEGFEIPLDLLYVITDMVTYYANPRKGIKSESITTHSYTKFDNVAPETEPSNLAVINKYAGPYGSATVEPTQGSQGHRNRWA